MLNIPVREVYTGTRIDQDKARVAGSQFLWPQVKDKVPAV